MWIQLFVKLPDVTLGQRNKPVYKGQLTRVYNQIINKITQLSIFACTVHLGSSVKILNNGVVSRYPSRSLVYNAVNSGLAAAECTLWQWAWLAKNCARVKCGLKERSGLAC